jgi:broad specificity phosphatase PhoE
VPHHQTGGREVLLLRHAETEWSLDGRHTGRTDIPLTENGRARGRQLGERLAGREFSLVLSSPLSRALETCELAGYGPQVQRRDDLLEWDYGEYEARTTADIRTEAPGWFLWSDGCPGGESADEVGARVDRVIEEVEAQEGSTAIFAHGHVLRALAARWIGLPASGGGVLALSTGSVCVLGYEREVRVLWRWNDTS